MPSACACSSWRIDPGFACYHLAEHHATELSTVPSPNLFLAAAAQRTRRLRLGALSYVLPIYDPIRLLEEICMLDQLSGGRLELGLSRGSTGELIDNDPDKARAMFNEALDVILMGLSTRRNRLPRQVLRLLARHDPPAHRAAAVSAACGTRLRTSARLTGRLRRA